ncbi:DUF1573 domain-containing protein [bacterium]|nr:DUF1573 domain-containing protein [bacterium]
MRKFSFIPLFLLAVLVFAQVQGNPGKHITSEHKAAVEEQQKTVVSKAKISFESENFDFGFAPQGNAYLVHYYTVTNIGEDTLHIKRVRPTCGCTAAPLHKKNLAPGESTKIGAIFRLRGYRRATSKAIKVESDDPSRKLVSLRFSANMDTSLWFDTSKGPRIFPDPLIVDLGKGDLFQSTSKIKIKNASDKKLTLKIIEYTEDILNPPKLKKTTLKPGKTTELSISVVKDYDIKKMIKASITIAAYDKSGSEVTRITIPIIGAGR